MKVAAFLCLRDAVEVVSWEKFFVGRRWPMMAESGPSWGQLWVHGCLVSIPHQHSSLHQTGTSDRSGTAADSQTAVWLLGVACSKQTRTCLGPHRQVASRSFTSLTCFAQIIYCSTPQSKYRLVKKSFLFMFQLRGSLFFQLFYSDDFILLLIALFSEPI